MQADLIPSRPDFELEAFHARRLALDRINVCGVDEAGRGPWAGPVAAAAVILDPKCIPPAINDSKKLTPAQREAAYQEITATALAWSVVLVDAARIDAINILAATHEAMSQAISSLSYQPKLALIDGNRAPRLGIETVCVVKGDALSLSIAAASIIAKVTRDRMMQEADAAYPGYSFADHKGYGVPAHARALAEKGPCPLHRFSFKPVRECVHPRLSDFGPARCGSLLALAE